MKYIFFGTPEFAAIILEKLIKAGMPPALVICNPDRPVGRKKELTPPPTKILAQKHGIPVWQPESLDLKPFTLNLGEIRPDFGVVAAYAKILPKEIIEAFPKGIIGVHPSLLPKYRGAAPIQSSILAGEEKTGTTLFLLDEKVDHGPILAQRELPSPIRQSLIANYQILVRQLAELSGDLLVENLPKFAEGRIKPAEQSHDEATFTKKFTGEDGFVSDEILRSAQNDGGGEAVAVDRKIRALNPEPGVYAIENGKRVKLLEAKLENGKLRLKKIQIEGEKPKKT